MKSILAFDRLNDIVFLCADNEFVTFIYKHAKEQGLLEPDAPVLPELDPNLVVQIYSPLVSSQRVMTEDLQNPYTSIHMENGLVIVLKQFGEQLHMAISDDESESEVFLERKLFVFQRLIGLLFGPVTDSIRPESLLKRKQHWRRLQRLMDAWMELYGDEQAFLVEAVEHLNVNQSLNEKCIRLLETVVDNLNEAREKRTQHALLLVNSKLLALYSNRNASELQSADILSIIILMREMLPVTYCLKDLLSYSCRQTDSTSSNGGGNVSTAGAPGEARVYSPLSEKYESAPEAEDNEEEISDTEFFSPCTTPEILARAASSTSSSGDGETDNRTHSTEYGWSGRRGSNFISNRSQSPYPKVSQQGSDEYFYSPNENSDEKQTNGISGQAKVKTATDLIHGQRGSSPATELGSDAGPSTVSGYHPAETSDTEIYKQQIVFLSTPTCTFTPHILRCIQLYPGLVLVIISELPRANYSGLLCHILSLLKEVMEGHCSELLPGYGAKFYETLDVHIAKLLNLLKKTKGYIERLLKDIQIRWNDAKKSGLLTYLEEGVSEPLPPRLEGLVSTLQNKLRRVFEVLYLSKRNTSDLIHNALRECRDHVSIELRDFQDYLAVKAQRNITMTNYVEDFPGLVHFIYVDRTTNQITAPSLNITTEETDSKQNATQWLKDKVWESTAWLQLKLSQACVTVIAREGDLHYAYFLWFEDSAGHQLPIQQTFKSDSISIPPGVLAGSFYRRLTWLCFPNTDSSLIHCYELYTIHVGLVPTQYIVAHGRKLANTLWETDSQVFTPLSLL